MCIIIDAVEGIGPTKALALMKQHRSIEKILESLDKSKYPGVSDNNAT